MLRMPRNLETSPLPSESRTVELHRARIEALITNIAPGERHEVGEVSAFFDLSSGVLLAGFPLGNGAYTAEVVIPKAIDALKADLALYRDHVGEVMLRFQFQHAQAPHVRTAELHLSGGTLVSDADRIRSQFASVVGRLGEGEQSAFPLAPFLGEDGKPIEGPPFGLTPRGRERWHAISLAALQPLSDSISLRRVAANEYAVTLTGSDNLHKADSGVPPIHGLTEFQQVSVERMLVGKHFLLPAEYAVLQEIRDEFDRRRISGLTHWDLGEIARLQFEQAWRWRNFIAGDEGKHPHDRDWELVEISQVLTAIRVSVEMLDNWRRLGRECFRTMREIGDKLVKIGSALPEKPGFTGKTLLEGVPLKDGTLLTLPLRKVLSAAWLHHRGWIVMREDMGRYAKRFDLPELTPPARAEQRPWNQNLPDASWLPDCRNFLGHCFMLALQRDTADRVEAALFVDPNAGPPFRIPARSFSFRDGGHLFVSDIGD